MEVDEDPPRLNVDEMWSMPEMQPILPEHYEEIREYFTDEQWAALSPYHRYCYTKQRRNYLVLQKLKLYEFDPPKFMDPKWKKKKPWDWRSVCVKINYKSESDDEEKDATWKPGCENPKRNAYLLFVEREERKAIKKRRLEAAIADAASTSREPEQENQVSADVQDDPEFDFEGFEPELARAAKEKVMKIPASIRKKKLSVSKINKLVIREKNKNRYPRRNIPRVNYSDLEVPDDDEYIYCQDCGADHLGPICPKNGPLQIVPDTVVPKNVRSRADKTIPPGLSIRESNIKGAGRGIFIELPVPRGYLFGPYEGVTHNNTTLAHEGGYCWQINKRGKPLCYVDAVDDSKSNWMRYVNCAQSKDHQNVTAFQYQGEIYYRAVEEIQPGEEMYVWYGDEYATELGLIKKGKERREFGVNDYRDLEKRPEPAGRVDKHNKDEKEQGPDVIVEVSPVRPVPVVESQDYKCDKCGIRFKNKSSFEHHLFQHTKLSYDCAKCNKSFIEESALKKHLNFHDEKRKYQCDECGERFTQVVSLQFHKRTHGNEKPYECSDCGKKFTQSGNLKTHKKIHSNEKPYECSDCGKKFSDGGNFKRHQRIHNNEKPYECSDCGEKFSASSNLKRHRRIHSKEKPYECSDCGERFSAGGNFKRHRRIHNNEKPYKCSDCGQKFSDSSNLKKHQRKIHGTDYKRT